MIDRTFIEAGIADGHRLRSQAIHRWARDMWVRMWGIRKKLPKELSR